MNTSEIKSPKIKPRTILALILFSIFLSGCAQGFLALETETPSTFIPSETPFPPQTETPPPSPTLEQTNTTIPPTPTPGYQEKCIHFEELNEVHIGEIVCVYGEILMRQSNEKYAALLRFAESNDHFMFRSLSFYWTGVKNGDCISMTGEIQWNGAYYFIEINEQGKGADVNYSNLCT